MVKKNLAAGFAHILLICGLLVLLAGVLWLAKEAVRHQKAVSDERALYAKLDKEAQAYIQTINAKYPGEVKHTKSCSYTSEEFGEGSLSCDVESTIEYQPSNNETVVISAADKAQKLLPWGAGADITSNTIGSAEKTMLYLGNKKQSCTVSYYISNLLIDVTCSGGALSEYYPVKE
jgi:hypothetical protein